jgi:hypothetical protein
MIIVFKERSAKKYPAAGGYCGAKVGRLCVKKFFAVS